MLLRVSFSRFDFSLVTERELEDSKRRHKKQHRHRHHRKSKSVQIQRRMSGLKLKVVTS